MDICFKKNRLEETKPMVHAESTFATPYYIGAHFIIVDCQYIKYSQLHIYARTATCNINSMTRN